MSRGRCDGWSVGPCTIRITSSSINVKEKGTGTHKERVFGRTRGVERRVSNRVSPEGTGG